MLAVKQTPSNSMLDFVTRGTRSLQGDAEMKGREWWIRPNDEPEHQNNYRACVLDKPPHIDPKSGHPWAKTFFPVIEKQAYDDLAAKLAIAVEALEFYSKPQDRIVDVAGKKHFIREYGCGCCSHSHDVDSDGSIGTMNCELDDVAGWTAREALAKIRGEE